MKFAAFLLLTLSLSAMLAAADPVAKPNVLVILADDQGWGDVGFNGNTNVQTPNLDRLARAGAILDRFFVCPVCSPTRAQFLTGRYYPRCGVRDVTSGMERLNLDETTIADTFKAAGYATGAFGKWHNGSQWPYHPNARGFQEYYGFTSGHWGEDFDPPLEHNGEFVRGKGYIADDLTDHAMAFIEKNRAHPFFCYLPFNIPHSPFCVPDEYWNRFKEDPIALRGALGDQENLAVTRCVLAMAENIDWNVGRLLRQLDDLHLAENTIVVYFSDNGPVSERWNGRMKGLKGSVDEGGVREPFCIRWPGRIKAGATLPQIAGDIDLLPTLASLAGVPLLGAKPLDGRDLSPLLLGSGQAWPERLIFSTFRGRMSVRSSRFRLSAKGALYDPEADPGQTKDLGVEHPEEQGSLTRALATWSKEMFPPGAASLPRDPKTGIALDDRPFTVGYREFPMTPLPARDGAPHGGVQRSSGAPNCSYFVNWKTLDDSITWDIEVHTTGEYEAAIYYTCPLADAGSTVELSFNGSSIAGQVTPGWDPPLIDGHDRAPRQGESIMKDFHPIKVGAMHLEAGRGPLTLRALKIPGQSVMDVRMVTLTLK